MGYPSGPGGAGAQAPVPLDYTSGPKPRTESVKVASANTPIFTGVGYLTCCTGGETTHGAPALAYLHDGSDVTDKIIGVLACLSGGNVDVTPAPPGIWFDRGIFLEVVSGSITVSVTFVPYVNPLPN